MDQTKLSPLEKEIAKKIEQTKPKVLQRGYVRKLIFKLHEPIEEALARGCDYDDLTKSINEKGIKINTSTLKRYHTDHRRQLKNEKAEKTSDRNLSQKSKSS